MKLSFVKESRSKGYLVLGLIDSGEKHIYTVSEAAYSEIGSPYPPCEIDGGMLESICFADECYRAKSIALRLLSYADNNERSLITKLVSRGIGREVACDTVAEMIKLGYVNEKRQLERIILKEANGSLAGPKKLIPKLMAKGYSRADIDSVIDMLCEAGEIDFQKNKEELIAKKVTRGATEEEISAILYKNGYSS